jgi:hypothetical protein
MKWQAHHAKHGDWKLLNFCTKRDKIGIMIDETIVNSLTSPLLLPTMFFMI